MADEKPMSPISEAVPPKANPLATPASAHVATLKLKPVVRSGVKLPPKPAVAPAAGLKLPPKPAVAPAAGLKLPPKPAVATAGLKLPPKPGLATSAIKPGVKLPARPLIHKPGAPITAPAVSVVKPATPVAPVSLKPVAPKADAPKPLETLKTVTQNLKSLTSPIPQQAILRKTGIIADAEMSEAQKQAAKSKTARISLSDAMGVAPVKNEGAPMKTIRIKRPVDIQGVTAKITPMKSPVASKPAVPVVPAAPSAKPPEAPVAANANEGTSFTQRKTLKISRPAGGAVRPAGKFGVKKPSAPAPAPAAAPATPAAAPAAASADVPEIADIPDIPALPVPPVPVKDMVPDVPKGVAISGLIFQIAACITIAFLGWLLYQDTQLPLYCGGCL